MSKVAIVILNWNGRKLLEQFLPSVVQYSQGDDIDIVVADNYSTDDSLLFLEKEYPQINRIVLAENYGYAGGYNYALKKIDAEYFVLLNSDVEVTENWLMPILSYMDENPDVVAAQPKILAQRNKQMFEYAGAAGGFIDRYGYPFCRGRILRNVEKDIGQYDTVIDILWASGACLFIRSRDFFEAGGFDSFFFAHMEEIDLCWRLNLQGKRIVCIPQSKVYHVGGATLEEESPRKTFLNFRNNLLMLYKNLPDNELNSVLRIRKFLDYVAALQFVATGRWTNAQAILNAHTEFEKAKGKYYETKRSNPQTVCAQVNTIYHHSILYDFYILGNKIFSKLRKFN